MPAHLISLNLLCLILFFFLSLSTASIIHKACSASRTPPACERWLSTSTSTATTALQVIQLALKLTTNNLQTGQLYLNNILTASKGRKNLNRSHTATTCLELINYSTYRINLTAQALTTRQLKEARAWMSAALVYHYACSSALKNVNDGTQLLLKTIDFFDSSLVQGSASDLGMIVNYDLHGENTNLWAPLKTERNGFYEKQKKNSKITSWNSRIPNRLTVNVNVCKRGCNYKTVQAAVHVAPNYPSPGKLFVIRIAQGVYKEIVRIPLEKQNVVLWGDGVGKTVITGSNNVQQPGMSTYNSTTFGVAGDRFMARGVTFENTAGPDAHQAVAFRSDSDQSVVENCEFIGHQDTLYASTLRQYYKSCRIQGTVDFIFGNSAAVFEDCYILVAPRQLYPENAEQSVVTAQGRTDPAQSTGFVIRDSVINGTKEYMDLYYGNRKAHVVVLGRPWKEFSRTVLIQCRLEALISKVGWLAWNGDFGLDTLYFGEYKNTGPGSDTYNRVSWSSLIPADHVEYYSLPNFIQAAN